MLQITAIGRLSKDPEIKTNKAGKEFVVFDIAVNKGYGDNKTTVFVSCTAGGALVSPLSKAAKGSLVTITGELSTALYQKKDGTTGESIKCFVNSFEYISTGSGNSGNSGNGGSNQQTPTPVPQPQQNTEQKNMGNYEEVGISSDDLPF